MYIFWMGLEFTPFIQILIAYIYTLIVQAASFYMPYILYKFAHDNRIPNLIQDLQNTKPFNEIRDDKLGDIHIYLQVNH